MMERVRVLEEALRKATSNNLNTHNGPPGESPLSHPGSHGNDEVAARLDMPSELIDTLGTLTLTDGGESRFLGPSAAPEV